MQRRESRLRSITEPWSVSGIKDDGCVRPACFPAAEGRKNALHESHIWPLLLLSTLPWRLFCMKIISSCIPSHVPARCWGGSDGGALLGRAVSRAGLELPVVGLLPPHPVTGRGRREGPAAFGGLNTSNSASHWHGCSSSVVCGHLAVEVVTHGEAYLLTKQEPVRCSASSSSPRRGAGRGNRCDCGPV